MRAFVVLCCLAAAAATSLPKAVSDDVDDILSVAGEETLRSGRSPQLRVQYKLDSAEYSDATPAAPSLPSQGFSSYWPWQSLPFGYGNIFGGGRNALPPPVLLYPVPVPVEQAPTREFEVKPNKNKVQEVYIQVPAKKRPTRPPVVVVEEEVEQPIVRPPPVVVVEEEVEQPIVRPKPVVQKFPTYVRPEELDNTPINPPVKQAESSKQILEQFLAQTPSAPELPPVLLSDHDASERIPLPDDNFLGEQKLVTRKIEEPTTTTAAPANKGFYQPFNFGANLRNKVQQPQTPKPLKFNQAMVIRGELTVPRADYTESYMSWYDVSTGSSRVDFHGGATIAFKTVMPDGSLQRLEVRVDKSGDSAVRRCGKVISAATAEDNRNPALPNLDLFSFAEYIPSEGGRVESWRYTSSGQPGALGGVRGEALTTRHELIVARNPDETIIPITYIVKVDSSALGLNTDGHGHRYYMLQEDQRDPKFFNPNLDEICDTVERLNATNLDHLARLNPLSEFTMSNRDPKYDSAFSSFKQDYNRQYVDNLEEAARKNLLIQHERFIASGNREGAPFAMQKNFLLDRLNVEKEQLNGVQPSPERVKAEEFPHRRSTIRAAEAKLPKKFDWRARGAVTPVKFQGTECSSCWAFAVAGSVEGALFVRKRQLIPLSEQCLIDCGHPYGTKGCGGTWPSHAFNYVQDRGLPAMSEYPAYKGKVDQCQDKTIPAVTKISAHVNVTANSVPALKVAIRRHAPTVVIVDGNCKSFQFYKKGVLYDDRCSKGPKKLTHAVLAVGWGEKKGEPNFILKNSWSDAWGDHGYIRVQGPSNTAGVLAKPSYPRLEDADVLRDLKEDSEDSRVKTRDIDDEGDDDNDEE